jgi:Family of unknown function (DUF5681)
MNPNLAEVGKPTRWPPGQSGNPAGKPPGTRTAFSQGFIRDFALVWAEEGLEAVRKVAKKSPEAFVAIAARICPNDVRLTLEQAIPGGMSLEDYSLMREVIAALMEGLPRPNAARSGISACARGAARLFEEQLIYEQSAARTVREQEEKRWCDWSCQPLKIEQLTMAANLNG